MVHHTNLTQSLPDPLRLKPSGVQSGQAAVYEDFGMLAAGVATLNVQTDILFSGSDPKRRMTSRPGSAVSYPRNDHLPVTLYTQQQFNEQGITGQPYINHQDAMERFNVRQLSAFPRTRF